MKQLALPVAHRRWLFNSIAASVMVLVEVEYIALGVLAWWALCPSALLAAVNWVGWWKTRSPRPRPAVEDDRSNMVDLGPLEPWPFNYIPKTIVQALELWHAAWERDHPELLGPMGASFYEPGMDSTSLLPAVQGIRPSEVRQILREMGVTTATAGEIDRYVIRAAHKQEREVPELPPLHVDPLLIGSPYKPQPPPGPGAATTAK